MMEEEKNTALMAEEMPMEEEAMPAEAEMAPEEDMPMEEEAAPATSMEELMGNFLDLPDKDRKIAQMVILGQPAEILDSILGAPTFSRIKAQLQDKMGGAEAPAEEPMAEEMPMEEPAGIMAETEEPMMDEEEEII